MEGMIQWFARNGWIDPGNDKFLTANLQVEYLVSAAGMSAYASTHFQE